MRCVYASVGVVALSAPSLVQATKGDSKKMVSKKKTPSALGAGVFALLSQQARAQAQQQSQDMVNLNLGDVAMPTVSNEHVGIVAPERLTPLEGLNQNISDSERKFKQDIQDERAAVALLVPRVGKVEKDVENLRFFKPELTVLISSLSIPDKLTLAALIKERKFQSALEKLIEFAKADIPPSPRVLPPRMKDLIESLTTLDTSLKEFEQALSGFLSQSSTLSSQLQEYLAKDHSDNSLWNRVDKVQLSEHILQGDVVFTALGLYQLGSAIEKLVADSVGGGGLKPKGNISSDWADVREQVESVARLSTGDLGDVITLAERVDLLVRKIVELLDAESEPNNSRSSAGISVEKEDVEMVGTSDVEESSYSSGTGQLFLA